MPERERTGLRVFCVCLFLFSIRQKEFIYRIRFILYTGMCLPCSASFFF